MLDVKPEVIALQAAIDMYSRTLGFPPIPTVGILDDATIKTGQSIAQMIYRSGTEWQHWWLKDAADGSHTVFEVYPEVLAKSFKEFAAARPDVMNSVVPSVPWEPQKKTFSWGLAAIAVGIGILILPKKRRK